MTPDPIAFLRATHAEVQAEAEAASEESGGADWHANDESLHSSERGQTIVLGPYGHLDSAFGTYFVRHDPAAVLRRIAAERKQLELHAAVPDHGRFSGSGCHAACDGTHEEPSVCRSCRNYSGDPTEAPCGTVEILAEGWGWTETPPSHD